ncbi:hypothetical protein MSHOH_2611 [Methanosarcina horonobensis HB-1 = JCM 15518]|uniref:DUF3467 domain-containing protein n=1 Tax=Methanosarcina horonobensis HB-1 = JCM 15518 TaxID=1434110 RepID=A0A0E3SBB1_9EURY|nr:hypothetical protein [Methanosarcina horonobensis]AKB79094.1 hypothetical protein MSHOH_2611 [Methanosarcina horonobensis HB-1 = JCM 15518]
METDKKISLSYAPQKVKTEKSDNYREVTQDRVFAGIREGYFIYMIQSEVFDTNQLEDKDEGHFTDEVLVRVPPQQMVRMHKLFGQLIKNYENIYGEIRNLEQIASEKPDLFKDLSSKS